MGKISSCQSHEMQQYFLSKCISVYGKFYSSNHVEEFNEVKVEKLLDEKKFVCVF